MITITKYLMITTSFGRDEKGKYEQFEASQMTEDENNESIDISLDSIESIRPFNYDFNIYGNSVVAPLSDYRVLHLIGGEEIIVSAATAEYIFEVLRKIPVEE